MGVGTGGEGDLISGRWLSSGTAGGLGVRKASLALDARSVLDWLSLAASLVTGDGSTNI